MSVELLRSRVERSHTSISRVDVHRSAVTSSKPRVAPWVPASRFQKNLQERVAASLVPSGASGRRIAWMRHGRPTTHSSQSCFLREFARGRRPARRVDGRKSTRRLRRFVAASTHPDERPDAVERNADAALGKRVDPRSSVHVIAVIERSVDIEEHAPDRRFDYFCSGMLIAPDPSAAISPFSIAIWLWMTGIACFANATSLLSEPSAASA
jgi:hypothetical protein